MAKQVKIWDKVSPINGVPAEKVTPNWTNVEEVVLILDENGRVLEMNDPAILKQNLGVSYYLNYNLLEDTIKNKGEDKLSFGTDIISSVRQYARKFTVNEIDLKKEIEKEIKLATKYKEEQIINIKGIYKAFLESNKSHFDKAISILR